MQINSYKLINQLLPTFMRGDRITEFIRVMLLQLEKSYNAFNANLPDWMYKANANASVISLIHHVKRELDVDILITELDGSPIDFLVTVQGFVDYGQLSKLLDTYALAGKSYIYESGEPFYSGLFINHVCEISLIENKITLSAVDGSLKLESKQAVETDITVVIKQVNQGSTIVYFENKILKGETIGSRDQEFQFWDENQVVSISPNIDDVFRYTFDNTGYELSLTLQVSLIIAGKIMPGYPINYQGRNTFTYNGNTYPDITVLQMRQMTHNDFLARLTDFKAYVESIELGLTIDISGAYRENLTSCPID